MDSNDGRARSTVATASLLGLALVAAALGAAYLFGPPAIAGVENSFGAVNETTTVIETDVRVRNPAPIGVTLGDVAVGYVVSLNDVRMAEGRKSGVSLGSGTTTVPFSTRMSNEKIPEWWVSHVRNGEHSELTVDATISSSALDREVTAPTVRRDVDTDIVDGFNSTETRALNASVGGSDRTVLYLNRTNATWGEVTDRRTNVRTVLTVYNPNSFPVTVSRLGYGIRMNGVAVGSGTTDGTYTIPPRSRETIAATTTIRNGKLDEWWVTHLRNGQVTRLETSFYFRFDLPFGATARIPADGMTKQIETDIFGTKASGGGGENANATATTTADGETATT